MSTQLAQTPHSAPPPLSSATRGGPPRGQNRNRNRRGRGAHTHGAAAEPLTDANEPIDGQRTSATPGRGGGRGRARGGRGASSSAGRGHAGDDAPSQPNGRPPRGTHSRRARFNATLSSGTPHSAHLHADASPFVPPASTSSPAPAPVNQTLVERLTSELTTGEADCSICYESITRTARIHSCSCCHTPFHLKCIGAWATSAVATSAEKAQLLASRDPRNPPDPATLQGHWSCPNCATRFTPAEIPTKYRCFCGRIADPQPRAPATPHSCARPCSRPRPDGCKHPCSLNCHPGPCPPCPVVLQERCHCRQRTLGIRCSALNDGKPSTAVSKDAKEALRSCGNEHGALLGCGLHRCKRSCHSGACDECDEVREKRCFCGKAGKEEPCGVTAPSDRVEGCRVPGGKADDQWTGEFSCEAVCGAPYDCSHHTCELPCHPHTSSTPPPCPFSPSAVITCPCGQTPLTSLLTSPRSSCTSPIPTCALPCSKPLPCGHACIRPCHAGPCPPCETSIPLVCRCGSSKTTRLCGSPLIDPSTHEEVEYTCNRICRAMRACGRHVCNRVCCPLSYQEAMTVGKGKGKRRPLAEVQWEQEMQDPMGLHTCDRVCGRKLNCGIHNCELKDHKGACPPCLRADFDELVCHCGSTVVLPPIPCNFVIDCRHPCIRPPACGHPQLPHACHEDQDCPPCPFLMSKICACGKKAVPNVRCSQDPKKVSCGTVCGKLLRCGWHRCTKTCHPAGECEAVDTQTCLKPRKHCSHPCPLPCHFPSSCPTDQPCPKMIEVHCACGNLTQTARCGACDDKPEGNNGRLIKCNDACALAKRNAQLADALGVEKKEPKVREVEYDAATLSYYAANTAWCTGIESQLVEFVKGEKPTFHFPSMKRPQRQFTHELAELFQLRSQSLDEEPHRSVLVQRQSNSAIPTPTLADALAAQRQSSSATLNLGSLRKALPERKPNNSLYLEGVLGYDEETLSDILRPHMRGMKFSLTWVTDEDVLVTFEQSSPDHETKLASITSALRHVISDTGFCVGAESVVLADDGRIVRGSWTPVASTSTWRPNGSKAAPLPLQTANSFASLGGISPPKASQAPVHNAWGSLIGAANAKPPRAVVAPLAEQERPILSVPPSVAVSRVPTPSLPPPPPVAKDDAEVPDAWDAEE
ncbi:hypothetical protein JCM5296_001929 [Sporobolomyces johnsonii]